jgi:hypothetical protein
MMKDIRNIYALLHAIILVDGDAAWHTLSAVSGSTSLVRSLAPRRTVLAPGTGQCFGFNSMLW